MAGECDKDMDRQEIKPSEKIEKKPEEVRDENLLEDILINSHPKSSKSSKADSLAKILNVSTYFFVIFFI